MAATYIVTSMQPTSSPSQANDTRTQSNLDARFIRMTTVPVSRLILSLAIPTIISMLVTALYNMADTFFVGKLSTTATAAVGVVFPLMTTIQVVGMTLGVGSGSFVARLLGRKDGTRASQVVSTAFFTALVCGIFFAIVGRIVAAPLMRLLGSTETILPEALAYANYILLGAPFMAAAFVMNVNLRSEGSAVLSMVGLASGAIINIALDPIFIFVFKMGVAGAAVATVISQIISFSILISHYLSGRSTLRINLRSVRLELRLYWEIIRSGTPTFSRLFLATLAAIVLNTSAKPYGDSAIAGMTVVNRIMMFIGSALIGFGQGFQPVAAFNYTAGFYERVHQAFWFAVKVGTVVLLLHAVVAGIFAEEFVRFFRDDPEVIVVGTLTLRFQCLTLPLNAFIIMSNMLFQYIGQAGKATLLAMSRQGLVFIPTILLLSHCFGLLGIQMSQALADGISFLVAIPFIWGTLRELRSHFAVPAPEPVALT